MKGLLLAAAFLVTQPAVSACEWINEYNPDLVIEVDITKYGHHNGWVVYEGERLVRFEASASQGYAPRYWRLFEPVNRGGDLITVVNNKPGRYLRGVPIKDLKNTKLITAGMGCRIWYSDVKKEPMEMRTKMNEVGQYSEGFWRLSKGCYLPGLLPRKQRKGIP